MAKKTCTKKSIGLLWKSLKTGDLLFDFINPEMEGVFFTVLKRKGNLFVVSEASNKPSASVMRHSPFKWDDERQLVVDNGDEPFKYFNETLFVKKEGGEQAVALYNLLRTNTIGVEKNEYDKIVKKEITKIRDIANIMLGDHDKNSGNGRSMEASAILNVILGHGNYTKKHIVLMMAMRGLINSQEDALVRKIIEQEEKIHNLSDLVDIGVQALLEEEAMGEA